MIGLPKMSCLKAKTWYYRAGFLSFFLASLLLLPFQANAYTVTTQGTYTGNGTGNRAVAHGLAGTPSFVTIARSDATGASTCFIYGSAPTILRNTGDVSFTVTTMDATNFYTGSTAGSCNSNTIGYAWVATYETGTTPATFPANANGYLKNDGSGTLTWDAASTIKTFLSLNNVENTALSTWAGTSNITTLGTLTTGTWNATTLAVTYGGTGQTSYTDGQLLIGNSSGNTLSKATITEGSGITVTNGNGTIELDAAGGGSLPADAEGFLNNDGVGNLSWQDASAGDTIVEDDMIDGIAIILYFGAFVLFAAIAFWRNKK